MKNKWELGRGVLFNLFLFSFLFNEELMIFVCKGQIIQHNKGQKMSYMAEYLSPESVVTTLAFFPRKGCRCSLNPNTSLQSNYKCFGWEALFSWVSCSLHITHSSCTLHKNRARPLQVLLHISNQKGVNTLQSQGMHLIPGTGEGYKPPSIFFQRITKPWC